MLLEHRDDPAAERRAECALDEIKSADAAWQRKHRRPAAMSARQALAELEFEALHVSVAALNLSRGIWLDLEDRQRLLEAHRRIQAIADEVLG